MEPEFILILFVVIGVLLVCTWKIIKAWKLLSFTQGIMYALSVILIISSLVMLNDVETTLNLLTYMNDDHEMRHIAAGLMERTAVAVVLQAVGFFLIIQVFSKRKS